MYKYIENSKYCYFHIRKEKRINRIRDNEIN